MERNGSSSNGKPERQQYDVAVWLRWPSLFPEYVALMTAENAVTAVELVMLVQGVRWAARVVVSPVRKTGRQVFRLKSVRLVEQVVYCGRVE